MLPDPQTHDPEPVRDEKKRGVSTRNGAAAVAVGGAKPKKPVLEVTRRRVLQTQNHLRKRCPMKNYGKHIRSWLKLEWKWLDSKL